MVRLHVSDNSLNIIKNIKIIDLKTIHKLAAAFIGFD